MPYLRFFRDERGYEHTYLLHGLRTGSRPRLLYWFRTPPNVSIGRLPLDEDAIRAIEDANADLTFDWARMLRVKPQPVSARAGGTAGRRRSRGGSRRETPAETAPPDVVDEPREAPLAGEKAAAVGHDVELEAWESPATSATTEEAAVGADEPREAATGRGHPVAALVGDDGLARLRAQYAELRARVAESRAEPPVREQVAARVEALNPDGWRAGEEGPCWASSGSKPPRRPSRRTSGAAGGARRAGGAASGRRRLRSGPTVAAMTRRISVERGALLSCKA